MVQNPEDKKLSGTSPEEEREPATGKVSEVADIREDKQRHTAVKPTEKRDIAAEHARAVSGGSTPTKRSVSRPVAIIAAVVVGVAAIAITILALTATGHASLTSTVTSAAPGVKVDNTSQTGTSAVAQDKLGTTVVASYTYDGKTTDVTALDVISLYTGISNAVDSSDSSLYDLPTADNVLSYVRSCVLDQIAQDQGLTASDDEITEYLVSITGSSSATVDNTASSYGLTSDELTAIVQQSVRLSKLESSVTSYSGTAPTAPTAPTSDQTADGTAANDVTSADYKTYVKNLVGVDYDFTNNKWSNTDSEYYTALSSYDLSASTYSYACATAAYNVAESDYETQSSTATATWKQYLESIFTSTSITIYSLKY